MNRTWKVPGKIFISILAVVLLMGCGDNGNSPLGFEDNRPATENQIGTLNFTDAQQALSKLLISSEIVSAIDGGQLSLVHGDLQGNEANCVYVNDANPPYNVYKIDPGNVGQPVLAGQLAFKSFAIALHPFDGKLYYVGANVTPEGVYPVGVWDPATNTNTTLANGTTNLPTGKLAFHPDGRLFGVHRSSLRNLYTIDTESGTWTHYATLNFNLGVGGDMIFSPDGNYLYSSGGNYPLLKVTEMATNIVTKYGTIGPREVSGFAIGNDGNLYYSSKDGDIGIVDVSTGSGTPIASSGLALINDMTTVIASTELVYANVTLDIPAGAMSEDTEINISMETTELSGHVAVTFEPHGTEFSTPAILNITALGVDFTGVDINQIDIYYDNPETGLWEPMERDDIIIALEYGYIEIVNAQLPHFSRYAIGMD